MHHDVYSKVDYTGKKTLWIFNHADAAQKGRKVIVLSHSLTGDPYEPLQQQAAEYFVGKGYDVIRLAYYKDDPGYRSLNEVTLDLQIRDFEDVMHFAVRNYKYRYFCGHGHGAMMFLLTNPDATALSFWDSVYEPDTVMKSRNILLFGEIKGLCPTPESLKQRVKELKAPAQVVIADTEKNHQAMTTFYQVLPGDKDKKVIPGADRCFQPENSMHHLFKVTEEWFAKHAH